MDEHPAILVMNSLETFKHHLRHPAAHPPAAHALAVEAQAVAHALVGAGLHLEKHGERVNKTRFDAIEFIRHFWMLLSI